MPLYEYDCPGCGERFSLLRTFGDTTNRLIHCITCGGLASRSFSGFSTPGLGRSRSRAVPDERMQSLLPYFAPHD